MPIATKDLRVNNPIEMSQVELDALYRRRPIGAIPVGEAKGTAIVALGTPFGRLIALLIRLLFWQGKMFNSARRDVLSRITAFRFKAILAKVYVGDSWLDEGKAFVLDYSKASLVAHKISDEIREVTPRLYLGKVYWARERLVDFSVSVGDQNR